MCISNYELDRFLKLIEPWKARGGGGGTDLQAYMSRSLYYTIDPNSARDIYFFSGLRRSEKEGCFHSPAERGERAQTLAFLISCPQQGRRKNTDLNACKRDRKLGEGRLAAEGKGGRVVSVP